MKKFLATFAVLAISSLGLVFAMPAESAHAAACKTDADSNFLSFPTWYRGLCKQGTDEIKINGGSPATIVFTIALNLLDIALRIVGILAVGYVIYGGFRYITSRGSPDDTKKAQDILLKAIIGLVIAMLSTVAVGFVVTGLNR